MATTVPLSSNTTSPAGVVGRPEAVSCSGVPVLTVPVWLSVRVGVAGVLCSGKSWTQLSAGTLMPSTLMAEAPVL